MMITLAMDTSCMTGGVAVLDGRRVAAEYSLSVKRTHSERLMSSVARLMQDASLGPSDIGLIACAVGPGSFTGIRIGVSSAKAMGLALGVKVAPVVGLDALAFGLPEGQRSWSVIDARHENCYAASYIGSGAAALRTSEPAVLTIAQVAGMIAATGLPHRIFGDASLAYASRISELSGGLAVLPSPEDSGIRPSKVGMLGLALSEAGLAVSAGELIPFYIKHSGAELKSEAEAGGKCPGC